MSTSRAHRDVAGLQTCDTCGLRFAPAPGASEGRCPRCDEVLEFRKPDSIQRTWAFLIAAAVCYIPANLLPGIDHDHRRRRRVRHHHARRRAAVVADRMAAFAHRAGREHHDSEREDSRARRIC